MRSNCLIFGGGEIAEAIADILGGMSVEFEDCDVRELYRIRTLIHRYKPKIVVNCAGISVPKPLNETTSYEREITTNLVGSFNVAQAAIQNNVETLIFIASVAGLYGKPNHAGYSASKSGVISLVQSLGMEGHNAYAVSPGRVNTQMREKDYPGEDVRTRLSTRQVAEVVKECVEGHYMPGDNIIIRKKGFETLSIVDRGSGWKEYLSVGEPPLV